MSLKKIPIITGFILLIVESISGQFQLIDDFNDGDSINTFGYPWHHYTESTYPIATGLGRPPAENKTVLESTTAKSSIDRNEIKNKIAKREFSIFTHNYCIYTNRKPVKILPGGLP